MKKILLLFLAIGLFSCTENNVIEEGNTETQKSTLRTAGDGIYDVLGYGYDITDEYVGETSVKRQIIDIKAFIDAGYKYKFDNPYIGIINERFFAGENALAMTKEIIKKTNFNGSAAAGISTGDNTKAEENKIGAIFSGSVTKDRNSKYSYSSKYSFARADVFKKQRQLFVSATPLELSKYLHQQFSEDLKSLTADQIVAKYGTHVMTDITIGGFFKSLYQSSIIDETSSTVKTKTVEAGLKINLGIVGLNFGGSTSTTEASTLNKKNAGWNFNLLTIGGTTNGHTITITPENPSSHTLNIGTWAQSVDDKTSKLIELNWNATYPIYDFISDATKKAQIKAAVEKYIKSKQIAILDLAPIYVSYSKSESAYRFDKDSPVSIPGRDWGNSGLSFHALRYQQEGAVALYCSYSKKESAYRYDKENPTTHGDWTSNGILCYVFKTQVPGTYPLYCSYSKKESAFRYDLYNPVNIAGRDWVNNGITCYVYP